MIPCIKWQLTTTPSSCGIPCATITGKGVILTGTALNSPVGLGVGTDGQILLACSAASEGLCWVSVPGVTSPAIPCAVLTAKGSLVTATAAGIPADLPVGTNGQYLTANSAAASGLCWVAPPAAPVATPTALGTIYGCTGAGGHAFLGQNAGLSSAANTANTAVGTDALCANTSGYQNVAIGASAGYGMTSGARNVMIGYGINSAFGATASNSLAIGYAEGQCWMYGDGNRTVTFPGDPVWINTANSYNNYGNTAAWINPDPYGPFLVLSSTYPSTIFAVHKYVRFNINGNERGRITTNNSNNGVLFTSTSDYRLKQDITDFEGGIERVKKIKVREFRFKANPDQEKEEGFLAHELAEAVPTAVVGVKDGVDEDGDPYYQSVDMGRIVPTLTKALQESIARIEALEAEIDRLKNN